MKLVYDPEEIEFGEIVTLVLLDDTRIKAMKTETSFYPEGYCFEGSDYKDYRFANDVNYIIVDEDQDMIKMTDEIAQKCMELHSYTQLPNCEGCPLDGLVEKDYCYHDAFELWYSNVRKSKTRRDEYAKI